MRTEPSFIVDGIPITIKEKTSGKVIGALKSVPNMIGGFVKGVFKNKRSKGTLSVSVYPSTIVDDKERHFHYELLAAYKSERYCDMRGTRYRVKPHPIEGHVFEKIDAADVKNVKGLLARIVVAEIEDAELMDRIITSTPFVKGDREWRSEVWVADVLGRLAAAVDGKAVTPYASVAGGWGVSSSMEGAGFEWATIKNIAKEYVEMKIVDGRYTRFEDVEKPRPTYSMLTQREHWA